MYLLEEYVAAVALAILAGLAATIIWAVVLTLREEERSFDRALSTGCFALPPSWPRLWLVMAIAQRWRGVPVAISWRTRLWWRRLARGHCKAP